MTMKSFNKCTLIAGSESSDSEAEDESMRNENQKLQRGQGFGFPEGLPPAKQQKRNIIKENALERQQRLLQIIMHIASIKGYNENRNIKDKNGNFVEGSDIVPLILYSLTKQKSIEHIDQFVDLLIEAKVPPQIITNEILRQRLMNSSHRSLKPTPRETTYPEPEVEIIPSQHEQMLASPVPSCHPSQVLQQPNRNSENSVDRLQERRTTRSMKRTRDSEDDVSESEIRSKVQKTDQEGNGIYEDVSSSDDDSCNSYSSEETTSEGEIGSELDDDCSRHSSDTNSVSEIDSSSEASNSKSETETESEESVTEDSGDSDGYESDCESDENDSDCDSYRYDSDCDSDGYDSDCESDECDSDECGSDECDSDECDSDECDSDECGSDECDSDCESDECDSDCDSSGSESMESDENLEERIPCFYPRVCRCGFCCHLKGS